MVIEATTARIAKLEMKPGDTLVVSIDEYLSNVQIQAIKDQVEPMLPKGVKAMCLGRGMTVTKLSATEVA